VGPLVLVIEDDPELRALLAEELPAHGFRVETANDGADGLATMRRVHPDAVVLDLLMPNVDGWQFRIAQRRDPHIGRVPVIATSASGTPAAMAVDADLFLPKPYTAAMLATSIYEVLAARARQDDIERAAHRERLEALGTLAAGLAHEINNPLTPVLLNLDFVERWLAALDGMVPDVDTARSHLRLALDGVERIREVLSSVRILAERRTRARAPIDPRGAVRSTVALLRRTIGERAKLVVELGEVPHVAGDEASLTQVLINLVNNAIHAIPTGAPDDHEVRIISRTDDHGRAVLEVRDTGIGIPDYLLPRIFEPFFTTKPVGEGTGLGLSISRRMVTQLGGELTLESVPGRGTTARVVLPAYESPRPRESSNG
jgi:signal transduction histidine kinase